MQRIRAGQPTVFRDNDSIECYLFNSHSCGEVVDVNFLFRLPKDEKRKLWILTDEALVDARWNQKRHHWFVVLAGSPAKVTASYQWKKDRNARVYYTSNWEWEEIVAAFR